MLAPAIFTRVTVVEVSPKKNIVQYLKLNAIHFFKFILLCYRKIQKILLCWMPSFSTLCSVSNM